MGVREFAADDFNEPAQAFFSNGEIFGAKAFLRTIDAGCALRSEKRILDIAGDGDFVEGKGRFRAFDAEKCVEDRKSVV